MAPAFVSISVLFYQNPMNMKYRVNNCRQCYSNSNVLKLAKFSRKPKPHTFTWIIMTCFFLQSYQLIPFSFILKFIMSFCMRTECFCKWYFLGIYSIVVVSLLYYQCEAQISCNINSAVKYYSWDCRHLLLCHLCCVFEGRMSFVDNFTLCVFYSRPFALSSLNIEPTWMEECDIVPHSHNFVQIDAGIWLISKNRAIMWSLGSYFSTCMQLCSDLIKFCRTFCWNMNTTSLQN